jgi:hypothetical protein
MARPNSDSSPTQDQIARRAYEIFEQRGRPAGCDLEHWLEAERQLQTEAQSRAARAPQAQPASASKEPRRVQARQPAGARA